MEWLDQLKVGGPLALTLGAGMLALWKKLGAAEEALAKSQADRIEDLKSLLKQAGSES